MVLSTKQQDTRGKPPTVETGLEPGDRFEIAIDASAGFVLPDFLELQAVPLHALEDNSGRVLEGRVDAAGTRWVPRRGQPLTQEPGRAAWLVYLDAGRWRLTYEPAADPGPAERFTEQGVRLTQAADDPALLRELLQSRTSLPEFELASWAARLATHAGFDQLMCLPLVRDMELLEHQIRTAKTVLGRFRGRAMLCDEVGLGKTIEAGLVLAELNMRGLVRSVLILTPPSLIEQWQGELRRKFGLDFICHDAPDFRQQGAAAWGAFDHIIASTHTAKREPHRGGILERKWDLVIIDEAHHLRNRTTQLWRFASELRKQYMLLLTATPVQNNLEELFNLVTLLEPGLLRTAKQFQRRFVDRRDKLTPCNLGELHELLGEVMVRNRRSTVGLQFTKRWARTDRVPPTPAERALYEDAAAFVRGHLLGDGERPAIARMALVALQMALGSSSQAAAGTLRRLAETRGLAGDPQARLQDLAERAAALAECSKVDHLLRLLADYQDKMVIFSQFRATQELLQRRLREAGHAVAVFHGGLSRLEKEAAIVRFRGPDRLLLATEAGSEGRNLQFAHAVCNFDLPWNPMKIEQRIGRLSRIGQAHDVHVFNLVAAGTIEAALLHLLEAKLNMFELVIGEIDMILGNLDDEREFQDVIADLWADAADPADFSRRMEELGERLLAAREAYFRQRAHDDRLFGDRFAPDG
jgi:SNF2 family DNA or RNA helicase